MAITNIQTSQTALQSSVQGAQKSSERFNTAANNVINGFATASNQLTARFEGGATEGSANISSQTAVAANESHSAEGNIINGIVNMKTSAVAYKASLEVFKVVDEMQKQLLDIKS